MTKLIAAILALWFISFLLLILYILIAGNFKSTIKSWVAIATAFISATTTVTIVSYIGAYLFPQSISYFAPLVAGVIVEDIIAIIFITRYSNSLSMDKAYSLKLGAGYTLIETIFQFSGIFYPIHVILSGKMIYVIPGTQIELYLAIVIASICLARLVGHYLLNIVLVTMWRGSSRIGVFLLIVLHVIMDCIIAGLRGSQAERLSISLLLMALVAGLLYYILYRTGGPKRAVYSDGSDGARK